MPAPAATMRPAKYKGACVQDAFEHGKRKRDGCGDGRHHGGPNVQRKATLRGKRTRCTALSLGDEPTKQHGHHKREHRECLLILQSGL